MTCKECPHVVIEGDNVLCGSGFECEQQEI